MSKYLALIRRTDFTDLFKYGSLHLNGLTTIEYDDDLDILDGGKSIINKLFENANLFESSFTYLIIEFVKANFCRDLPVVDMEDVVRVYPLDREAKKEFETSFDEHIRIESPRWEQAFSTIQRIRTKKDCEKGAKNVSRLYGIQEEAKGFREIITDDILEELVTELYQNIRPAGSLPIWVYMLRYERHAFYPEETVGFFMDAVHVVCNYMNQSEIDETAVSQTSVMRFLESSVSRGAKMDVILDQLASSEECARFLAKVRTIDERVDLLKVAVLFFILKKRYQDGLRYEPDLVGTYLASSAYKRSFSLASYLVGLVLGHDKTYEALYENLPLPIYKTPEEMAVILKRHEYERQKAMDEMLQMEREREMGYGGPRRDSGYPTRTKRGGKKGDKRSSGYGGGQKPEPFRPDGVEAPKEEPKEEVMAPTEETLVAVPTGNPNEEPEKKSDVAPMESSEEEAKGKPETVSVPDELVDKSAEDVTENPAEEKVVVSREALPDENGDEKPETESSDASLFSVQQIPEEPRPIPELPCTMGKLKTGTQTQFCSKPKPKVVETVEEYNQLYDSRWRVMSNI